MRQRVWYLYVELKKTIGMFPRMLLQAILLMILIGAIAFCGVKGMEREPLAVSVDVGVVVREDNRVTRMAIGYVESMESVAQICRFVQVTEKEGLRMLEGGEIAALIVLPEQLVEGILNGQNPSVDIIFPENARLEAMLFRELTESGTGLLRVAQAQIYGASDTAVEYGITERLSVIEAEIDSYNLAFALDRMAIYDEKTVSVTGRMSVLQYYAASAVVLFLLLSGMAAYPVMQQEPEVFRRQLIRQRVGTLWQYFCKWLCGFLCIGLLAGAAWALFRIIGFLVPAEQFTAEIVSGRYHITEGVYAGVMLFLLVTVTTLIYMIYSLAQSRASGILLIFLFSVLTVYLSGGFVPSALMPQAVRAVGDLLPTAYMIRAFGGLLAGYDRGALGQCMTGMCVYTAVFGAAGYFFRIMTDAKRIGRVW